MSIRPWFVVLAGLVACDRHHESSVGPAPGASSITTKELGQLGQVMSAAPKGGPPPREKFDAAELAVPPGKSTLHVAWALPTGTSINDDAPFSVRWGSSDGLSAPPSDIRGLGKDVASGFDVPLDLMKSSTGAQLSGDIDLVVCDAATHSVCVPIRRRLELTFAVTKGANGGKVTLPLPQARP